MRTAAAAIILPVVLAGSALTLTACSSAPKDDTAQIASFEPINTICPLGGHEVDAENPLTTTYAGHTIAFCCEGCAEAWPSETDESKQQMLSDLLAAREG